MARFGLAGSGIACRMLAAESGPLFISGGVVFSLSPSATEAGPRFSTGCCGSLWVAASPQGMGCPGQGVGTPSGAEERGGLLSLELSC